MDSVLAFLNNQQFAIIAAFLVPFLYKYIPAFKNFSNGLCTLLAAVSAWVTNVFGPTPAHAAPLGGALVAFGGVFVPLLDALFTRLVHDWVLNPAYKAVGLKTPQATK